MASIRPHVGRNGTSYQVRWRDPDRRTETSMSFPAWQEAENFRRILESLGHREDAAVKMLDSIRRKVPSVAQVLETHIDSLSVAPRTQADYRRDAKRYIVPTLGHVPADALDTMQVKAWLQRIAQTPAAHGDGLIADKTIANIHGLLSAAMNTAKADLKLRPDNPCQGVHLPRRNEHEAVEMVCLTHDDWAILDEELGKVLGGHHQMLFRTMAGTGMRWGEAAGLRVSDLSLAAAIPSIRIRQAQKRDENSKSYIGPTKTKRSRRTISLDGELAADLAVHVKGLKPTDRVFRSRLGNPLNHSNVRTFAWVPAVNAALDRGMSDRPRIHDLRHTHVSWLIERGIDLLTIQARVGHEKITTTAGTYGHVMTTQQAAAAAAAGAAMRRHQSLAPVVRS